MSVERSTTEVVITSIVNCIREDLTDTVKTLCSKWNEYIATCQLDDHSTGTFPARLNEDNDEVL